MSLEQTKFLSRFYHKLVYCLITLSEGYATLSSMLLQRTRKRHILGPSSHCFPHKLSAGMTANNGPAQLHRENKAAHPSHAPTTSKGVVHRCFDHTADPISTL